MKNEKPNSYVLDNLKIMIVSTPKTGNTWVKHLLSNVYQLPIVRVGQKFNPDEVDELGQRWITHQHYRARADIIDYGRRNNIVFVTTIRHPGDTLLSKFHFVRNYIDRLNYADIDPSPILARDGETMGENTLYYLGHGFSEFLDISLSWIRSGESHIIRYEDLWRDPVTALQELTASIHQVSLERVKRVVELCDIGLMRKTPGTDPKFFRKGSVGNWKNALPQDVIDVLRREAPYPAQFTALGYTLEPDDPLTTLPRKPRVFENPFHNITHFDNGVQPPPLAVKLYLSLEPAICEQWPDLEQTGPDSFYAWLNSPADKDPRRRESALIVTNLAHYIYRTRPDVHALCPDLFGEDRLKYATWFIINQAKYELDPAFIAPMRESLLTWSNMPAEEDPHRQGAEPVLTNIAVHIYHQRPDLQAAFPDLFGEDRLRFARWFVNYARISYASHRALNEPIRSSEQIISRSLPEANNAILALVLSLRHRLSSLVSKARSWISKYR